LFIMAFTFFLDERVTRKLVIGLRGWERDGGE